MICSTSAVCMIRAGWPPAAGVLASDVKSTNAATDRDLIAPGRIVWCLTVLPTWYSVVVVSSFLVGPAAVFCPAPAVSVCELRVISSLVATLPVGS